MPVDIVLLGLHGAMVADGYDDCEGDLLARTRELVGADTVIGSTLDPHCHLSDAMVKSSNVLVCFKEYPHTDIFERASELFELCRDMAQKRTKPVAYVADCHMILVLHTTREPVRSFVDRLSQLERADGILSISVVHGFPWGDVADMGTKVLVYSDGDRLHGQLLADSLAEELVAMREMLTLHYPDIDCAIDECLASETNPVVLADSADNAGGGAPGDSTFILGRLLERGIGSAALGPLCDPGAVRIAFEAGVGARLRMRIGGKVGPVSGSPLDVECTVKVLCADMMMSGLAATTTPLGDCALVDVQGVEVVLCSVRCQGIDIDFFTQLGCNPCLKKIVVVKSSQHFLASFSKITDKVIYVDSPGALCTDFRMLSYRKIQRPKWPF